MNYFPKMQVHLNTITISYKFMHDYNRNWSDWNPLPLISLTFEIPYLWNLCYWNSLPPLSSVQSAHDILSLYRHHATHPPLKVLGTDSGRKNLVRILYFILKAIRCVQVTNTKTQIHHDSDLSCVGINTSFLRILAFDRNVGLPLERQEIGAWGLHQDRNGQVRLQIFELCCVFGHNRFFILL